MSDKRSICFVATYVGCTRDASVISASNCKQVLV